ncbi:MAG: hypothetical protein RLZZ164_434 [Actinomycetota bacterium]|jgi:uncharacterized protein (DUF885 family)
MTRQPSELDKIADAWVDKMADMSPSYATYIGRKGSDHLIDDPSPEAIEEHLAASKQAYEQVKAAPVADKVDEVTKDAMLSNFELGFELHDSGMWKRDLDVLASPAQGIRDIFDLSPTDSVEAWENLAKRMRAVDGAVDGYIRTLRLGIEAGDTPARRQVEFNIKLADGISAETGFFNKFAAGAKAADQELPDSLKADLIKAGHEATAAYGKLNDFFKNDLLPNANEVDAIGRERYSLFSRKFLGAKVDLDETYEWGIEELARVTAEQNAVANEIKPGASVKEAIEILNNDASRKLHSKDELKAWMQNLSDEAIRKLNGVHFDIAEPLLKLECMIAPTNSGVIYYTGPTDDFSRPGRMWWSVPDGVNEFDTWRETTTVYHEGVPGHHLQIAQQVYNRAELNSWRRLASWCSGHGEGWALYAERLMADLGFLNDPGDRLGMLDGQRMRAARVVLDLGVHLGKKKLEGSGVWDFDYALDFMGKNVNMSPEFVNFEVHRYFGWPGQAPSYKIGQRIWEQIRDDYAAKKGAEFDIKEFHKTALNLGALGLDNLRRALVG